MLEMKEYVRAESLEQAYELNQKKTNRIVGGMLWMKMQRGRINAAIDLSGLGLDQIEETEDAYLIGCMATLRQLETHAGLNELTQGAMRESVRSIVGVQFRNMATVGGSIFGRFGFSDVLTMFLAMDSYVELYKGGIVSMRDFVGMKKDNDILVRIIVKKAQKKYAYLSHRNAKTDFPVLAVALSMDGDAVNIAVGARPHKAVLFQCDSWKTDGEDVKAFAASAADHFAMGSNMRGSAEYRSHLARVLIRRGMEQMMEGAK